MGRAIIPLALLLAVVGCDTGEIRVCTWNLHALGANWRASEDTDLDAMARIIDDKCDLVGVQEIYHRDPYARLMDRLRGHDDNWDGTSSGKMFGAEYYGVLFRKDLAVQAEPSWRCPSGFTAKSDPRPPCAVLMDAGASPFWLVDVHIKGSRTTSEQQADLGALRGQIHGLIGAEAVQERVVMGDFNVEAAKAQSEWGSLTNGPPSMHRLTGGLETNLTENKGVVYWSKDIDHMLWTRDHLDRLDGNATRITPADCGLDLATFHGKVSDHVPLRVTLLE